MEQRPICNQSVRLCRKALRKRSCSLVLYLLCELTEIIFLNGIKSEGELQPGQSSATSYRPPSSSNQPYRNCPQPQHCCLQSEEADEVSDRLGPDLKKVFKHLAGVLNCLSAKFLSILAGSIKSGAFEQDLSQSHLEAVHNISHGFIIPGNKSLEIHNDERRNNSHSSSGDLKALCSHYLGFLIIAEEKAGFCLFVSNA